LNTTTAHTSDARPL